MKISAVIPAYNASRYIREAVSSVLNQTRAVDEVIVVDDCSTDDTVGILSEYPVQIIEQQENSGHAASRNAGVKAASGSYIAWIDADDVWDVNHIETVAGLLERHPKAGVAYSHVRYIGDRSGIWEVPVFESPAIAVEACFRGTFVPAMSCITTREAFESHDGFDESIRISPDFDFWLRLSKDTPFVGTNKVTANWRWHPGQISSQPLKQLMSVYDSRAKFVASLRSENEASEYQDISDLWKSIFMEDLAHAWYVRDRARLQKLLGRRSDVGVGVYNYAPWLLRSSIPLPFLKILDAAKKRLFL